MALAGAFFAIAVGSAVLAAEPPGNTDSEPDKIRTLFVPFNDLRVLLESGPRRVMLDREQYEALLAKSRREEELAPPAAVALTAAEYEGVLQPGRAQLTGTLHLEVLAKGLHAVPLDLASVGLRSAELDEKPALLGQGADGVVRLFIEGVGRHVLKLDMVAPVEQTAARQSLRFRLPQAPSASMRLTAPGDVELKGGAAIVSRQIDKEAELTRFEILLPAGDATLEFSLNSRLLRQDRVVLATSVLIDEITEAYERLHATVSLDVLHRPVDRFLFAVPVGFEVTDVHSPQLARWNVERQADKSDVLEVTLREPTTETVVLNLAAVKAAGVAEEWSFPQLVPLDVAGQVAVLGIVAEDRLETRSLAAEKLIAIDTSVFEQALPPTLLARPVGDEPLRPIAAYYAPQGAYGLTAKFARPSAELAVTASTLLNINEQRQAVRGGFAIQPSVAARFAFSFSVPAGWHVTAVTGPEGEPLPFERYGSENESGRIHVTVSRGMKPDEAFAVAFEATHAPAGWLDEWSSREVDFPRFDVLGATRSASALAVTVAYDLRVRPETIEGLTPLDETEKADWNLAGAATALAYRAEGTEYAARLTVERAQPRLAARTFSFFQVTSGSLKARCEIVYQVDEASTNRLSFALPAEGTPESVSIVGLDGLQLKQFTAEVDGNQRLWTVELAQRGRGLLRLACDFEQPLDERDARDFSLPIARAMGTVYQSGFVAVEGDSELDVQVTTDARRVDVGELAEADYLPGRRLLGAFAFVGEPVEVKIDAVRHLGYRLPASIVEFAELNTRLGADGASQTLARFNLRTKAQVLEVELPAGSELWAARLDETPLKPQRAGDRLLLNLPSTGNTVHELEIVYASSVAAVSLVGNMRLSAPSLRLRADDEATPEEVPLADLKWNVYPPTGYRVVRSQGSVHTDQIERPRPAAVYVAGALYWLGGGVQPFCGGLSLHASKDARPLSARRHGISDMVVPQGAELEMSLGRSDVSVAVEGPAEEPALEVDADTSSMMIDQASAATEREALPPMAPALPKSRPAQTGKIVDSIEAGAVPIPNEPLIAYPDRQTWKELTQRHDELLGVRSLQIDFQRMTGDNAIAFRSLGVEPVLAVTLSNRARFTALAWAIGVFIAVVGLLLTCRKMRCRAAYVVGVMLVASIVPVLSDGVELAYLCNAAFFAASALVPYYLLVALCRWLASALCGCWSQITPAAKATTTVLALVVGMVFVGPAQAQAPRAPTSNGDRYVVQIVEPDKPVAIPDDALLTPYDSDLATGIRDATKVLVPYQRYVELWNRAYPDQALETPKPPADYAMAGAAYRTVLGGDEFLLVEGELTIDVFTDGFVEVPLALRGGVLARAVLDDKPARLSLPRPMPQPVAQQAAVRQGQPIQSPPNARANDPFGAPDPAQSMPQQAAPPTPRQQSQQIVPPDVPDGGLLVLHVSGKGSHTLKVITRLRLRREGGWRVADGVLPAAPAAKVEITVPEAETQLRLSGVVDQAEFDTEQDNQLLTTALGPGGTIGLRWRPKVAEAEVDRSLTAHGTAVMDVQEDGLRVVWRARLDFPRAQREQFTINVPADYLVKHVSGQNVRGWELSRTGGRQSLEIALLHAAKDNEEVVLDLWREGPVGDHTVGDNALAEFAFPVVRVPGAVLEDGQLTVRRSPLLELRVTTREGVSRTDLDPEAEQLAGGADTAESPLGIRPYQAYRFATAPFNLSFAATTIRPDVTARLQTVLRIAELERMLETRVVLNVQDRPLFRVDIELPDGLRIDQVIAPGEFHWSETTHDGRRALNVYLAAGQLGEIAILVAGKLGETGTIKTLPLPRISLAGIERQSGEFAVQTDPGLRVDAQELTGCERILPKQLYGWLNAEHREVTQLALSSRGADYSASLVLSPRKSVVACRTISNVRVTTHAVEETILVEFDIREAGIRQVAMLLPHWMADCRVRAPLLRQKTITPAGEGPQAPVRMLLEFQDEMMGELRVLLENDRLLTADLHEIAIPRVETGRTERQFVAMESAGRDEVVVEQANGLETLGRQQRDWQTLKSRLGDGITQAWTVSPGAAEPQLAFRTQQRKTVATAGAQVRLAETTLVLDLHGAYRAQLTMKVDNATEQFLEVQLPAGATLWTARVAGEPVKPIVQGALAPPAAESSGKKGIATDSGHVYIPLVKTAAGDVAYDVVLGYGGALAPLGVLGQIEFPLLTVHNMAVDRSQVRLLLPEGSDWFDFEGTLGRPADRQALAAGWAEFQREQVEQLLGTLRHGSTYEKARSAQNLKQLDVLQNETPSSYRYADPQGELEAGRRMIEEAQKEVDEFDQGVEQTVEFDNRARMNDLVEQQRLGRSRNVVQNYGYNWNAEAAQPRSDKDAAGKVMELNAEWLNKNQLANAPADDLQDGKATVGNKQRAGEARPSGQTELFRGKGAAAPAKRQPEAPKLKADVMGGMVGEGRGRKQTKKAEETSQSSVRRYQQRLEERQQAQSQMMMQVQPQPQMDDADQKSGEARVQRSGAVGIQTPDALRAEQEKFRSERQRLEVAVPQFGGFDVSGQAGLTAPPTAPLPGTGLASLDFTLPQRGRQYVFTTTGGRIELRGRHVSRRLLWGLGQVAAVLAALGLGWLLLRAVCRGGFRWLARPAVLGVLGLLALVVGVFPVFAVIALAAAVVMALRRLVSRKHATPALDVA